MSTTPISATLAQTDRDAVLQAITTIKEKLPFLVDLSADDRKTLPKMGDKSRAVCKHCIRCGGAEPRVFTAIVRLGRDAEGCAII